MLNVLAPGNERDILTGTSSSSNILLAVETLLAIAGAFNCTRLLGAVVGVNPISSSFEPLVPKSAAAVMCPILFMVISEREQT